MATDVQRQTKTDEIYAALGALKTLADEAIALDMIPQMPVGNCTIRLDEIDPDEFRDYLDKTFEATP